MYKLSDYQYELPEDRIAQLPVSPADSARLLVPSHDGNVRDAHVSDLSTMLGSDDVIFFNDTRVVKARVPLHHTRVVTKQGREVIVENAEMFFLEKVSDTTCEALITLLKRTRPGTHIYFSDTITIEITALTDKGVMLAFDGITVDDFLQTYGHMPLPPYIAGSADGEQKYQTVFAKHDGSVAAPTASLHFTPDLIHTLQQKGVQIEYVTLHVGLGTFKPVDTADIRDYHIHEETIVVSRSLFSTIAALKSQGKRLIAVGTTVARVLETLPYAWKVLNSHPEIQECHPALDAGSIAPGSGPGGQRTALVIQDYRNEITTDISAETIINYIISVDSIDDEHIQIKTRIFIYPGFQRKLVDMLMTNFHIPGSTLLMLVAAFVGYDHMKKIYTHAIQQGYRFYSFGDAMLLSR